MASSSSSCSSQSLDLIAYQSVKVDLFYPQNMCRVWCLLTSVTLDLATIISCLDYCNPHQPSYFSIIPSVSFKRSSDLLKIAVTACYSLVQSPPKDFHLIHSNNRSDNGIQGHVSDSPSFLSASLTSSPNTFQLTHSFFSRTDHLTTPWNLPACCCLLFAVVIPGVLLFWAFYCFISALSSNVPLSMSVVPLLPYFLGL
jgi:hypothetical protein